MKLIKMNAFFHALLSLKSDVRTVSDVGDTMAYTWFGRPNYAYSESANKYWIGTTLDTVFGTTQHITQYDVNTDTYTTTQVGTVYGKDDHNQSEILIRQSDNRLIAFYTEHNGAALRYRISTNPLDATIWDTEIDLNPTQQYSYISPYQSSNGDIFLFFRNYLGSGIYAWAYLKSTDGGVTFGSSIPYFNNGMVQAYLITGQDGDKIHFIGTNGHPENNPNLNINTYHFYFDMVDETSHKSDGTVISIPMNVSDMTEVNATSGNDTSWILDITCKNNLPRIIYVFYPNGRVNNYLNKELYFVEWNGAAWVNKTLISQTLSGYVEDDSIITEAAYPPASRFDTSNSDIIWMPKQVNGILEIHKVDLSINPIYIEQLTFESDVDNWRPISTGSAIKNLLWLKKNVYTDYIAYDMSLMTKTELTQ